MRENIFTKKRIVIILAVLVLIILSIYLISRESEKTVYVPESESVQDETPQVTVIGKSVEGRNLEAYKFGNGNTNLLFVGGIHGGYEWNSVLLAYELIDYLTKNPNKIPDAISVTVVPSANPDGVFLAVGKEGRFGISDAPEASVRAWQRAFPASEPAV